MMIPHIYDDADGHSHFGEIEIVQKGTPQRISAANQDVSYWQMSVSQPGFVADWHPTGESKLLCVFSGQMALTVSNGETRHMSRGDILFAQDMKGQGHAARVVGTEPCVMLQIAMPGGLK
jgi:gentisate 1,2-dioxygenase